MSRPVPIRLEDEVLEAIRSHPNYQPTTNGRTGGGVGPFVRDVLREYLELPPARDAHAEQAEAYRREREEDRAAKAAERNTPKWFAFAYWGRSSCPRGPWQSEAEALDALQRWRERRNPEWCALEQIHLLGYRTRAQAKAADIGDDPNVLYRRSLK